MNKKSRLFASFALSIGGLVTMSSSAFGHAPLPAFTFHKATNAALLPHSALNSLAFGKISGHQAVKNFNLSLPGPGSLTARNFHALINRTIVNGIGLGQSQVIFPSGAIKGGILEGDLYQGVISGGPNNFVNAGEFTGNIGVNLTANVSGTPTTYLGGSTTKSGIQNTINFAFNGLTGKGSGSTSGGLGNLSSLFPGHSGSQRAFQNLFSGLTPKSISIGQQIGLAKLGGNTIVGGEFNGTFYRNSVGGGYFSSFQNGSYVFAFGNNPLNNPSTFTQFMNISVAQQRSFLLLSNGSTLSISNGQILFPQFNAAGQRMGSVLTMGSNPANTHMFNSGPLTNLSSYLFF